MKRATSCVFLSATPSSYAICGLNCACSNSAQVRVVKVINDVYIQVMDAKLLPATALVHVCEVCTLESYSLSYFLFDIIVIT